jgi:hypothetical protein
MDPRDRHGDTGPGYVEACPGLAATVDTGDGRNSAGFENLDKSSGYDVEPGPLDWCNSARVVVDPDDDAITCLVSVGDPRGAFAFTVRRLPDGRIVLHLPHPGESLPHCETRQLHPGTLVITATETAED